ncbi:TIGR02302 family protein [Microvirga tunisiensis]|uniref:TIGR02302 family protein n=1 Tax=Pannonibacter tanglangensis TaxID=2750084 RepID=A0A7X5JBA0_9HYPH|nr:TIGR02302 family protein [Pannonibacter sp. XCT-53]
MLGWLRAEAWSLADPIRAAGTAADLSSGSRAPDKTEAERRLKSVVGRSRLALVWERLWPELYQALTLVALFVGVSWLGFWLLLPGWARLVGVAAFALALLYSLRGLRHVRLPSDSEALHRVELASGHSHRPLTALIDDLPARPTDPVTLALWQVHKDRMAAALRSLRAGFAHPQAFRRDPYALRVVAFLSLIVGAAVASGDRMDRLTSAFRAPLETTEIATRLDAWVTPPVYTGRPPVYLTGETAALRDPGAPIRVPAGSELIIRAQGLSGFAVTAPAATPAEPETAAAATGAAGTGTGATAPASAGGVAETRLVLTATGPVDLSDSSGKVASWMFEVEPDTPPTIRLLDDPETQLSGALKLSYLASDDYRVLSAEAAISPAPRSDQPSGPQPRPLVEAPQFPLSLPPRAAATQNAETIRDLTSHPWAGSDVDLVLTARDEAGQTGQSEPHRFTLPQRGFSNPLARAVVEQRRELALDAHAQVRVIGAFDALMLAPDVFEVRPKAYLGLTFAYRNLVAARSDDELRALLPLLWDLALTIEDGDLSLAERALREAQENLRKALEEGASDEEIARLTEELRKALQDYMQALAEQLRQNPQAMQPFNPNQQTMRPQDLEEMLKRIEELARTGSRDAARELLAQMQRMLENLQTGRPQMAPDGLNNEMMEMLNQLGQMIQRQQELMDQTNRMNRDQRQQQQGQQGQPGEPGQPGQPGQPGEGGQQQPMTAEQLRELLRQLEQGQGDLAQQLQQLMEQMGRNGMGENEGLGEAGDAMGQAQQSLGQGAGEQAAGQQGNALDALRRGAQQLGEQMMGEGEGPGMAQQRSPLNEDPLGRPRRTEGPDLGSQVKVPDEIDVQRARRILEELRRRFSDPSRPRLELDYLERLLRNY